MKVLECKISVFSIRPQIGYYVKRKEDRKKESFMSIITNPLLNLARYKSQYLYLKSCIDNKSFHNRKPIATSYSLCSIINVVITLINKNSSFVYSFNEQIKGIV